MQATRPWHNWSGSVSSTPRQIAAPGSEAEVAATIREAARDGATVRVVGSGHSFVPLCATDGVLVTLDALHGVVAIDPEQRQATVWAGRSGSFTALVNVRVKPSLIVRSAGAASTGGAFTSRTTTVV